MRLKETAYIFLALAIAGAGVWYFQTGNQAASVSAATANLKSTSSAANNVTGNVETSPNAQLGMRAVNNNSIGLFNEPVRSMMRSDKMAKIDYARLRVLTQCLAFMSVPGATRIVEDSTDDEAKLSGADKLMFGRASLATRRAALSRSIEACSRLFEGSPISGEEWVAYNAQPNTAKWRALVKVGQRENFGTDLAATKEFIEKIVSEPMFGTMEGFLYGGVSNTVSLAKDYPPDQARALRLLMVPFLLCQMGDDCRTGGIVSEQLCWKSGICGENVQDAILEHLRSQQINTAAFEQYVTTLRQKNEQMAALRSK